MNERAPILSTMWYEDRRWKELVEVLVAGEAQFNQGWFRSFWHMSKGRQALILRGTVTLRDRYRDLVGAALVRRLRRRPPLIVISDATIQPRSRELERRLGPLRWLIALLAKGLIKACDGPTVRWCVLSKAERQLFASTWNVPLERIYFTSFSHTLWNDMDYIPREMDNSETIRFFSGGNSLRDYQLLLHAFADVRQPLTVATTELPAKVADQVTIKHLPHEQFIAEMRAADVVVIALEASSRSAGQQTYLNAMALAKVVIVSDPIGAAADYIVDGVTGVLATPGCLNDAIKDVCRPERQKHYDAMRKRAREVALTDFSPGRYTDQLLAVAGLLPKESRQPTSGLSACRSLSGAPAACPRGTLASPDNLASR